MGTTRNELQKNIDVIDLEDMSKKRIIDYLDINIGGGSEERIYLLEEIASKNKSIGRDRQLLLAETKIDDISIETFKIDVWYIVKDKAETYKAIGEINFYKKLKEVADSIGVGKENGNTVSVVINKEFEVRI